jgi:integrase/recombinase XerD
MRRIIMKTIFYVSTRRINKKGVAPIYLRITINGRRCDLSTGIWIKPIDWHIECLDESNPDNTAINAALSKIKNNVESLYYELIFKEQPVTAEIIKNLYTGSTIKNYTFIQLLDEYIIYIQQNVTAYNTIKSYNGRKNLLLEYLALSKQKMITPELFTLKVAENYQQYLLGKKLKGDYVNRQLAFMKAALHYAVRMEIIKFNPIASLSFKHDKPKPIVALTKAELLKLVSYTFECERLQQVADMYVFQSFTGFAYVDLFDFDYYKHVKKINKQRWIFKARVKNDIEAIIPMFNDAKRILRKYRLKLPVISNQKYNEYLKEIFKILSIDKDLTTHTARKTFAMIRINDGFSIESVARMMGHNSIKITQSTYAQVGIERISNEYSKIGFEYKKPPVN